MTKPFIYLLVSVGAFLADPASGQVQLNPTPTRAIGQLNLVNGSANLVEGREFNSPLGIALDTTLTPPALYVADTFNNRVLGFRNAKSFTNGQKADIVIGQIDFLSAAPQGPGVTGGRTTGTYVPTGLAVDGKGNLFVVDSGNNRILRFPAPFSQTAQFPDLVIGQLSFSTNGANAGGPSEKTLNFLSGSSPLAAYISFDSSGNLWVADSGNNRVLRYPAASIGAGALSGPAADIVIGQIDFASIAVSPNYGPTYLNGVQLPTGIAFDNEGRLYVGESASSVRGRILIYNPPFATGMAATRLIGVVPSTVTPQPPAISEQQLGVAPGGLFVLNDGVSAADPTNNRILVFPPVSQFNVNNQLTQQAVGVIGQKNFSTGTANQGQPEAAADRVAGPQMAAVLDTEIYVLDSANNRVIVMPYSGNAFSPATRLLGQEQFYLNAPNLVEGREFRFISGAFGSAGGIVADFNANPPHLYVADTYNNRILGFKDLRNVTFGSKADIVIGQPDFQRTQRNYPTNSSFTPTASGLFDPIGLALDLAGNLYVADTGNGRVVRFPTPFANPPSLQQADLVLGQRSLTGPTITDASNATMAAPTGLAFTGLASGAETGLLVSDQLHNRVLYFPGSSKTFTSGMAATKVFGQANFTSTAGSAAADNRFQGPRGISSDVDDRLYVADTGNNRIAIFDRAPAAGPDPHTSQILASISNVNIVSPAAVFVNQTTGEIWVTNSGQNQLLRYPRYADIPLLGGAPNYGFVDTGAPLALTQDAFGDLFTVDTANRVIINFPGLTILNAASYVSRLPLAPGAIGSMFGFANQFTTKAESAATVPLPTTIQNVQVLINGTPSPIYYLGPNQINFQVPKSIPSSGTADVLVQRTDTGQILGNFPLAMDVASPAIFTINGSGQGQVAAINQDGTVNGQTNPAPNGSVITFFGTGQGVVPNAPPDGTPSSGIVPTSSLPIVIIGTGNTNNPVPPENVQYSGLAPGLVGVWQVNVKIPDEVAPTSTTIPTPVVFQLNGIASNGPSNARLLTTMWVKAPK
jgi:uncharacterized protein (TIGR03437 family)